MGCICSKGIDKSDLVEAQRDRGSIRSLKRLVTLTKSKREEVVVLDAGSSAGNDGSKARLISESREAAITPTTLLSEEERKLAPVVDRPRKEGGSQRRVVVGAQRDSKLVSVGDGEEPKLTISDIPNGFVGEHVAAGWPSWLTAVAGEAVKGWLPRKAESFEKLDKIGQGTYSSVYKARDLETGKIVALKKVRFVNMDPESVRFMAREIYILRRLHHPNVVKLEALVTSRTSCSLYLVLEYMEHDLAGLSGTPTIKFTESQVKCYMQQLLHGLDHCHSRGVLHRDIKGSNLLIDNNGILKIADFGLATFFNSDQKQQLTSRVVTLWYRPPELLLGATEYGISVDLWSTGCILAELLVGKPIMPGRTEVEQLHKIFKLCGSPSEEFWMKSKLPHATIFKPQRPYKRCVADTFRNIPSPALALLDTLLSIEPAERGSAAFALNSEFFTTDPLPCDPSSLPKYPPSKEFDAKLRDEEVRRQRAAAMKGNGSESGRRLSRESKVMQAPEANAEVQNGQVHPNPMVSSDKYNPQDDVSKIPAGPLRSAADNGFSHSVQLGVYGSSWTKKVKEDELRVAPSHLSTTSGRSDGPELRAQRSYTLQGSISGLGPTRNTSIKRDSHWEKAKQPREHWPGSLINQLDVSDASEKQEWLPHLLDRTASSHKKDGRIGGKEPTTGYGAKKNMIHYSGPLMPPGGNMEEMLKEHERQIQQAVRKVRLDKTKAKKDYGEKGQSEALLYRSRNGRSDA